MTSPPNRPRGSARVPGPDEDGPGGSYQPGPYRPAGRASAGRAYGRSPKDEPTTGRHGARHSAADEPTTGRRSAGYDRTSRYDRYDAPTGRASAGRASVGGTSGRAPVGSASVGSARVGRAPVRPGGPDGPDDVFGPGFDGPDDPGPPAGKKKKKKGRKRKILALAAAVLLLAGIGLIGGTYYFTNVKLPQQLNPPQVSTIYDAANNTIAKIGTENRTLVDDNKIPEQVKYAVVAAEDQTFYTNSGIDFKGIARALVSNVTGGSGRQGASTITQQYAKLAENANNDAQRTYTEKLKEAVVAMKLTEKFPKDKILGFYLNTAYFGRNAYGIQSAAQAYFHKNVQDLTAEEAAVIASTVKDPTNFDPQNDKAASQGRWQYVLQGMIKLHKYNKPVSLANYPMAVQWAPAGNYMTKPTGMVVKQVETELEKAGISEGDIRSKGLQIHTTIMPKIEQDALEAVHSGLKGQPDYLRSALVAVQPGTGRVLAYYGGEDGTGWDLAGHAHQPGSSFKVYALATGVQEGVSVKSWWNGDPKEEFPDRPPGNPVSNSDGEKCDDGGKSPDGHYRCSLTQATVLSLNTVFYALTSKVGKDKVITNAAHAGIRQITSDGADGSPAQTFNLTQDSGLDQAKRHLGNEVGFGQYPVTPLDHANGFATLANNGRAAKVHFVEKVLDSHGNNYNGYREPTDTTEVFSADTVADVDSVLEKVATKPAQKFDDGRPQANKTGTWQYKDTDDNAHAWMCGYIPKLASVVWMGHEGNDAPIRDKDGQHMYGSMVPGTIWGTFMNAAAKDLNIGPQQFPTPKFGGDKAGGQYPDVSLSPSASASPSTSHSPGDPWGDPGTGGPTPPGDEPTNCGLFGCKPTRHGPGGGGGTGPPESGN